MFFFILPAWLRLQSAGWRGRGCCCCESIPELVACERLNSLCYFQDLGHFSICFNAKMTLHFGAKNKWIRKRTKNKWGDLNQPIGTDARSCSGRSLVAPADGRRDEGPILAQVLLPEHGHLAGGVDQHPVAPGGVEAGGGVQAVVAVTETLHQGGEEFQLLWSSGEERKVKSTWWSGSWSKLWFSPKTQSKYLKSFVHIKKTQIS